MIDEISLWANHTPPLNKKYGYGFGLGVYRRFKLNTTLDIVMGLSFDRTRVDLEFTGYPLYYERWRTVFVTIPAVFRFNFGSGKWKPYFETGFALDILRYRFVEGRNEEYNVITQQVSQKEYSHTTALHPSFAWQLGAGITFPLSDTKTGILKIDYKVNFNCPYDYLSFEERYFRLALGITY